MDKALSNTLRGELVGLKVNVLKSKTSGRIIDETKNTFIIETEDKQRKTILKANNQFEFWLDGKKIIIDGKELLSRPEDRIKLKVKS